MTKFWKIGERGGGLFFICFQIIFGLAVIPNLVSAGRRHPSSLAPVPPTPEALRELADAMGASVYEDFTADAQTSASRPSARILKTSLVDDDVEYQNYQGVMGRPGIDFPVLPSIPHTDFNCKKVATGYYADLETDCQVFHICDGGRKISFLCPNGTIFHQSHLICDWWFKVDCLDSPGQYEESAEHLAEDQRRSNKQSLPTNFETIQTTTQRRPQNDFGTNIHSGRNHVNEYKAEASFTSVAQSAPRSDLGNKPENILKEKRPSPRTFQVNPRQERVSNSRQYSSFEHSPKEETNEQAEEIRRKDVVTNYEYTPTKRTFPDYTDSGVYRGTPSSNRNSNSKETQVVAESASFYSGRGRVNYNQYSSNNENKVRVTPEPFSSTASLPNARTTRPTYTTTYVPGTKNYVEVSRSISQSVASTRQPSTTTARANEAYQTASEGSYDAFPTASQMVHGTSNLNNDSYSYVQIDRFSSTSSIPHNFQSLVNDTKDSRQGKAIQNVSGNNRNSGVKNANYWTSKVSHQNIYEATVPTVTPKAVHNSNRFGASHSYFPRRDHPTTTTSTTQATPTEPSYASEPIVVEHAEEMMKTLEELELASAEPTTEAEKLFGRRPGLIVPPSAGPNTLHSLAIYFATAVDNLVSTPAPTTATEDFTVEDTTEPEYIPEENKESYTSLLSQNTLDRYTRLFENETESETPIADSGEDDVSNDLELSQSRGPLSSSPQIRELAQVFTHALSAYLQDPETFRKVLSEIRPTDPTTVSDYSTTTVSSRYDSTTNPIDYYSVTKEDDEVLDFSDVSKDSHKTSINPTSDPQETTTSLFADATKSFDADVDKNQIIQTTALNHRQHPTYYPNTKDKTPASRIVTQGIIDYEIEKNELRKGKALSTTLPPPTSNAIAIEINGGLSTKNDQVTFVTAKINKTEKYNSKSSYFPIDSDVFSGLSVSRFGGFQNNSSENYSPYGEGVKPSNATPISGELSSSIAGPEAVPLHWGDTISTQSSSVPLNPSAPSVDLLPPSSTAQQISSNTFVPGDLNNLAEVKKTTQYDYETTATSQTIVDNNNSKERVSSRYRVQTQDQNLYDEGYKVLNDNDEQLQRAHSQSFVSSANQLNRRGKKIKSESSNKKEEDQSNKKPPTTNATMTVRTSNGLILTLPTLKDILSKPTSTLPTEKETGGTQAYVTPADVTSTTVQETTFSSTTLADETTTQYQTTTVSPRAAKSSPRPRGRGTTSQYNVWSTSAALGHLWQTTVFLDPMTINDGLISDQDSELILPSANTYRSGAVTQKLINNQRDSRTTTTTQSPTDSSSFSTFTTPLSTIRDDDYTTRTPEVTTTFSTQNPTYETLPPIFSTLTGSQEYLSQLKDDTKYNVQTSSDNRKGKSYSSPSPILALERLNASEVDLTMMNKAKEMFGGLNASSANTLMNVMKQADRNTTVRRLILLLVQTCDDDHNKTIEASRTALLDALIRIPVEEKEAPAPASSQNPTSENFEVTGRFESQKTTPINPNYFRRSDEIIEAQDTKRPELSSRLKDSRKGKSYEPSATVSNLLTTAKIDVVSSTTTETIPLLSTSTEYSISSSTSSSVPVVTYKMSRRGNRKFYVKSTKTPVNSKTAQEKGSQVSGERSSTSSLEDASVPSDTRALELLRSLYSLAARWG